MPKYTVIDHLCLKLNEVRRVKPGEPGHHYYANIAGDGRTHRTVYTTLYNGGVAAVLNGKTPRQTAKNIRDYLEQLKNEEPRHDPERLQIPMP